MVWVLAVNCSSRARWTGQVCLQLYPRLELTWRLIVDSKSKLISCAPGGKGMRGNRSINLVNAHQTIRHMSTLRGTRTSVNWRTLEPAH
jgi:hypothetical protein